jgi:hypothetical protein
MSLVSLGERGGGQSRTWADDLAVGIQRHEAVLLPAHSNGPHARCGLSAAAARISQRIADRVFAGLPWVGRRGDEQGEQLPLAAAVAERGSRKPLSADAKPCAS